MAASLDLYKSLMSIRWIGSYSGDDCAYECPYGVLVLAHGNSVNAGDDGSENR